tara:strand:+ start:2271 stop:3080 length:810 start_codon:yes stop_codon:yes gene_type:complete
VKTAVCLHGYYGTLSTNDFSTSNDGRKHIEEEILSKTKQVDFFVHCWQPEMKEKVLDNYSPKGSIFEEQVDFSKVCENNRIYQNYIDSHFQRNRTMYKNATAERILSFYYSRCKSLKMAIDKDYDWIITTRFDISARGGNEVNRIRFLFNEERDHLYTTDWNQKNVGYGDMWFYGSNNIMKSYSKIYDEAIKDFKPLSNYEKILTTAWPDSNFYDLNNFEDPRQFTNEIEKKDKSQNLMKFPKWRMTDSHLHHKWFCMQNGLYEKTRWV